MAYDADGFKTIAQGGAIGSGEGSVKQVHSYASNDTVATIAASGYFNSATSLLRKGDILLVHGDIDGTPDAAVLLVSSATGSATVTTIYENAQQAAIVSLTDSTGGSGSHDDTLADGLNVTAPAALTGAALTGSLTGTVDGVLADVAAVSTAGGNTYADSAINTAITDVNLQLKELQTALNETTADVEAIHGKLTTVISDLAVQNQNDSDLAQKVLEILTALRSSGIIVT